MRGQWIQIGETIIGEDQYNYFGYSVDLNSDGSILAVGANGNSENGGDSGHVRVFEHINGEWLQIGADINGEAQYDNFGTSVSLSDSGSIIAIGAINNEEIGHVKVYENNNNNWSQIGDNIDGINYLEYFGHSVSLSGDGSIIAIGGPGNIHYNNNDVGRTRIFRNINGTWSQIGNDIVGEVNTEKSGYSVSLNSDGTIVVIGAPSDGEFSNPFGSARVFQNINDSWIQIGDTILGENAADYFGNSVSISSDGSIVAIGAMHNNSNGDASGQVRIFEYSNNSWTQIGEDINGESEEDFSGCSVSLNSNGTIVAIGARYNYGTDWASGHVRLYENINGNWNQNGVDIDGETYGNNLGYSVSLNNDGSILSAGAPFSDGNGDLTGHVKVFGNGNLGNSVNTTFKNSIFPNPTKGILSIKLNHESSTQFYIYDITGKLVLNQHSNINNKLYQVDISNFENGVYILIIQEDDNVYTRKIIKE